MDRSLVELRRGWREQAGVCVYIYIYVRGAREPREGCPLALLDHHAYSTDCMCFCANSTPTDPIQAHFVGKLTKQINLQSMD